ncbi:MAG TPA: hypothetical protein P5560_04370 [Thermotogota bacterium]|nr:hypothetical protein [Thermotogota bacterium]HRW92168.1 hypothetical protein [Thermotogota bacterium]
MKELVDVLYDAQYLKNLQDFQARGKFIRAQLSRKNLKQISPAGMKRVLERCSPVLREKVRGVDSLSIVLALDELLYGKERFVKRLKEANAILGTTDWILAPLLFFTAPSTFFNPSPEVVAFFEKKFQVPAKRTTYLEWNQKAMGEFRASSLPAYFSTPLELSTVLFTRFSEEYRGKTNPLIDGADGEMIEELLEAIVLLDLFRLQPLEVNWMRELFFSMEAPQKMAFLEALRKQRIHPYIKKCVTQKPIQGVIVDGSNIILAGLLTADPYRLRELMNAMGIFAELLFPVFFVFDANADFIVNKGRDFWEKNFLQNPTVTFQSPADAIILKRAHEKNYRVVSNDRFRDYGPIHVEVLRFQPDKGRLFLSEEG